MRRGPQEILQHVVAAEDLLFKSQDGEYGGHEDRLLWATQAHAHAAIAQAIAQAMTSEAGSRAVTGRPWR